jgi:hypothetical protein
MRSLFLMLVLVAGTLSASAEESLRIDGVKACSGDTEVNLNMQKDITFLKVKDKTFRACREKGYTRFRIFHLDESSGWNSEFCYTASAVCLDFYGQ